jgi:hypothetical protein
MSLVLSYLLRDTIDDTVHLSIQLNTLLYIRGGRPQEGCTCNYIIQIKTRNCKQIEEHTNEFGHWVVSFFSSNTVSKIFIRYKRIEDVNKLLTIWRRDHLYHLQSKNDNNL